MQSRVHHHSMAACICASTIMSLAWRFVLAAAVCTFVVDCVHQWRLGHCGFVGHILSVCVCVCMCVCVCVCEAVYVITVNTTSHPGLGSFGASDTYLTSSLLNRCPTISVLNFTPWTSSLFLNKHPVWCQGPLVLQFGKAGFQLLLVN